MYFFILHKKDALIEHEKLLFNQKNQGLQFEILIQLTSKESQQGNYVQEKK